VKAWTRKANIQMSDLERYSFGVTFAVDMARLLEPRVPAMVVDGFSDFSNPAL